MRYLTLYVSFCVLAPLFILNVLGALIGDSSLFFQVLRGGIHILFFVVLLFMLLAHMPSLNQGGANYLSANFLFFMLLSFLILLSMSVNGVSISDVFRGVALILFSLNLLLLFPFCVLTRSGIDGFLSGLERFYIFLSLVVLGGAITFSLIGFSPYNRLGFPLIPGVFAYYLLLGLIVSISRSKYNYLGGLYFAGIVLSGSRSSLALALISVVLVGITRPGGAKILMFIFAGLLLSLLLPNVQDFIYPYISERKDFSSGRFDLWEQSLDAIGDSTFLGYGRPQLFYVIGEDEPLVPHNSFLDLTLTYGVIFSLLAYLAWFVVFYPRRPMTSVSQQNGLMLFLLFWAVFYKSMVTNTFWLNMGDPATFFVTILLVGYSISYKKRHWET